MKYIQPIILKQHTGVLLVNLGTPAAPTASALRAYLAEFLWDPRVIESPPRPLWWLILHGMVLRTRPAQSAEKYRVIWQLQGSPLWVTTAEQAQQLQQALATVADEIHVEPGMRYGEPSIAHALQNLAEKGCERIIVLPLYPQYSASTVGSVFDAVADALKSWRVVPELQFINRYHRHPAYLQALASSIQEAFPTKADWPQKLIFSFHGVPVAYQQAGDSYPDECYETAQAVADRLQLAPDSWQVCFQSRFGRAEWLQPYTDKTLEKLAQQGLKTVAVICPGFSADCLETLEEINVENRHIFLENGGEQFHYIPALNSRPDHIQMMQKIIQERLISDS